MHMHFFSRQVFVIAILVAAVCTSVLYATNAVMAQISKSTRTQATKGSSSGTARVPAEPVVPGGGLSGAKEPQLRVLKFPSQIIGDLSVHSAFKVAFVGRAQGTVRIIVPAYSILSLEVNGRLSRNPELLLQAPEHGIEQLKVSLMDMENETESATDRVVKYSSHLKDLTRLDVTKSDITDKGCAYMEGLPNLVRLDLYSSLMDKKGLENVCKLSKLRWLKLQQTFSTQTMG